MFLNLCLPTLVYAEGLKPAVLRSDELVLLNVLNFVLSLQ